MREVSYAVCINQQANQIAFGVFSTAMLSRTVDLLTEQMHGGLHTGFQLYVSVRSEAVASVAAGVARPDGTALTPETLMLWMSAGKPVTAVAVAQLWERGLLDLDDAVAKFIPEFAANGKDVIT